MEVSSHNTLPGRLRTSRLSNNKEILLCFPLLPFHLNQTGSLSPIKSHAHVYNNSSSDKASSLLGELRRTAKQLEETDTRGTVMRVGLCTWKTHSKIQSWKGPLRAPDNSPNSLWQKTLRPSSQVTSQDHVVSEWQSGSESQPH